MALVTGVVRDPDGEPVEAARVYFAGGPSPLPDIAALTGPDGRYALSAPAPGAYEVECTAECFAAQRETVEVAGDEESRLDFRLGLVD